MDSENPVCKKHEQTVSNRGCASQKRCDTRKIVIRLNHALFSFRPKTRQDLSTLISLANRANQFCLIVVRNQIWSVSAAT